MIEVIGNYGTAKVFSDDYQTEAIDQVRALLDHVVSQDAHTRIMPDYHLGSGCVIGYTAKIIDKVIPNLVGVDIGCGVRAWYLGDNLTIDFEKLDKLIREKVPSGKNVNADINWNCISKAFNKITAENYTFIDFKLELESLVKKLGVDLNYVWSSVGSLGGGNHFIEINISENNKYWLTVHSGSRNLGLKTALYHQDIAMKNSLTMTTEEFNSKLEEIKKTKKGKSIEKAIIALKKQAKVRTHKKNNLEYLDGFYAENYYKDVALLQTYAKLNRTLIGQTIIENFFSLRNTETFESVHNYINFEDGIVRKGAISAHTNEKVIVPLNMAEGCVIGTGKGNEDYNSSAPHGAGRLFSRSKARQTLSLIEYQERMDTAKVWSSCISSKTLDESPMAYKSYDMIKNYLAETINIEDILKPVYNFKAQD